jgi:hypothetical protein
MVEPKGSFLERRQVPGTASCRAPPLCHRTPSNQFASRGRMSQHTTTPTAPVETPEAFLADRQSFWNGFTHFTQWSVVFIVILLVLMAIFLL